MGISEQLAKRTPAVVIAAVVIVGAVAAIAFEPVTRNVVFRDFLCLGCHSASEYVPNAAMLGNSGRPITRVHPATPEGGETRCIECHLPPGLIGSAYAYTHVAMDTDLFGHWRDFDAKTKGKYLPPMARRAYSVQDRLLAYDSSPCRTCHIEAEIKPKKKRGQKAHKNALKNKETCIECHDNLVHRPIPLRVEAE